MLVLVRNSYNVPGSGIEYGPLSCCTTAFGEDRGGDSVCVAVDGLPSEERTTAPAIFRPLKAGVTVSRFRLIAPPAALDMVALGVQALRLGRRFWYHLQQLDFSLRLALVNPALILESRGLRCS